MAARKTTTKKKAPLSPLTLGRDVTVYVTDAGNVLVPISGAVTAIDDIGFTIEYISRGKLHALQFCYGSYSYVETEEQTAEGKAQAKKRGEALTKKKAPAKKRSSRRSRDEDEDEDEDEEEEDEDELDDEEDEDEDED